MNEFKKKSMGTRTAFFNSRGFLITVMINCFLIFISGTDAFSVQKLQIEKMKFELPEDAVSIGDLVQYAYENNPSIWEAREAWNASIEKFRVEIGYPDPQLKVTYFPDPIETRLGPQDWNATISQKIPFPGKLSKAGEIAKADVKIARLNVDKSIRDVIVAIRESFYELYYIRNAKRIVRQNEELLNHLRKISETGYAQDRGTLMDVVKAQSQTGQLGYDALLLDDLEVTEITRLNGLLNRSPEAPVGKISTDPFTHVKFSLEELYAMAEKYQEEIKMASVKVRKAEAKADLARFKNYPEFNLGIFYAAIGDPDIKNPPEDAGRDALGIQGGITIPLWINKNKGRVNLSLAEKKKAQALRTRLINKARTDIRALYFRLKNADRLIKLYQQEMIPQASRSMELAETWYKEGESSFSDFIETQSVWYNFHLSLVRAKADYGKYLARLERLVGRDITHLDNDISPDDKKEEK